MKKEFVLDFTELIAKGNIENELEYERALVVLKKLRLMSKKDSSYSNARIQLRKLIEEYEEKYWGNESEITNELVEENDLAEKLAERERVFLERRKRLIKESIKSLKITQQDLGVILGHSKSYTSELINGVRPFSLVDIVFIHRLLKIQLSDLVPIVVSHKDKVEVKKRIQIAGLSDKVRVSTQDFELESC